MTGELPPGFDVVEETVAVGAHRFVVMRPRSADELIDEDDYAVDERLPYWADLWPSGRVLAEWLAGRSLSGARVVELGCGLGIPSFVAAAAGASVLATDWYEPALGFVRWNARRSDLDVPTMLVDWRAPGEQLLSAAPFDLVVAADVLYEARNVAPLRALLPVLTGSRGEVVLADPRRPDAQALLDGLARDGWSCATTDVAYAGRRDESGPVVKLHRLAPPRMGPDCPTFG